MVYLSVQRDCVSALEPCDCLKQSQFCSKSAVFLKSVPAYAVINLRQEHIIIHACISPQRWTHLRIPSLILMPALCASLPELFVSKASLSSSGSSTHPLLVWPSFIYTLPNTAFIRGCNVCCNVWDIGICGSYKCYETICWFDYISIWE